MTSEKVLEPLVSRARWRPLFIRKGKKFKSKKYMIPLTETASVSIDNNERMICQRRFQGYESQRERERQNAIQKQRQTEVEEETGIETKTKMKTK